MKISTRARYGTRAMLDLALSYGKGKVMVKDIAQKQKISPRYLEQLLYALKMAGLVRSVRGTGGGFVLARPPQSIKIIDIVEGLDGSIAPVNCVDLPELYPRTHYCAAHDVWAEVKRVAAGVLSSLSLQDLVYRQLEKEAVAKKDGKAAVIAMYSKCDE
ncbi:MAG: Rrf2 family transcriptional regulator [Dehalococcoidia bacterium]|nr:Rrf2 family transcriptional regulator [Dehalococcoidia bacterium]